MTEEDKPISKTELRKWHHQILVSVIAFALVVLGIMFLVDQADRHFKYKFQKMVIQLNELSDKKALESEGK